MNFAQLELVRNAASAVLWRIEDLVEYGNKPFEEARRIAVKEAQPAWRGFSKETADGIRKVVSSLTYGDLHRDIRAKHRAQFLDDIEKHRGKRVGPIERLFFNLTGLVWWV